MVRRYACPLSACPRPAHRATIPGHDTPAGDGKAHRGSPCQRKQGRGNPRRRCSRRGSAPARTTHPVVPPHAPRTRWCRRGSPAARSLVGPQVPRGRFLPMVLLAMEQIPTAGAFDDIHGGIGAVHERLGILPMLGVKGNPDADAYLDPALSQVKRLRQRGEDTCWLPARRPPHRHAAAAPRTRRRRAGPPCRCRAGMP